jgi:Fe-S-cluster containining protein
MGSSSSLCDQCSGLCCRYFALPLDNPRTVREYDNIRWYLLHENVVVFIEKKQWYIGVMSRCKHLEPDNRCGIYHERPRICREFSTENCDYHGGDYGFEKLFTSGEQLRDYAEEKLNANRKGKRRLSLIPRPKRPRMKKLVANGHLVALSLPVLS